MAGLYLWIFIALLGIVPVFVNCEDGYYLLDLQGKSTQQSSTHSSVGDSDHAVDGNPDTHYLSGFCTHTQGGSGAWWAVDLGSIHTVYSVGLVNRGDCCGDRLDDFIIYGYNETFNPSDNTNTETCYDFSGDFNAGADAHKRTFTCNNLIHARYIGVKSRLTEALTLCEVYITAACEKGKYGEDCVNSCSGNCQQEPCERVNGFCPDGQCKAGYEGDKCDKECDPGKYGENCVNSCSDYCKHFPCSRFSGVCPDTQCVAGYKGDTCDTPCEVGAYGENCVHNCSGNCQQEPCSRFDGFCPEGQCKAGYEGDKCDKECDPGKYGKNCVNSCSAHCKQLNCSIFNGTCPDRECTAGYKGDTCDTPCEGGTYGENCVHNCSDNCQQESCDRFNGFCHEGQCKAGYEGDRCDKACDDGTYGDNCTQNCSQNCKTQPCDKINGWCPLTECMSGFHGNRCENSCEPGKYGEDCVHTCSENCKQTGCNKTTGDCANGECKSGYEGRQCQQALLADPAPSSSSTGAIAGGVVAALAAVVVVVVVIVILRRRKKQSKPEDNIDAELFTNNKVTGGMSVNKPPIARKPSGQSRELPTGTGQVLNALKTSEIRETSPDEVEYMNVEGGSKTKIRLENVDGYIHNMNARDGAFLEEYEDLPKKTNSWEEAGIAELKSKNRYVNILPYDFNRVKLEQVDNNPLSTYINASYIEDYDGQKSYIAALGATDQTVNDVWRMIWETNISNIVMVTKLAEAGKSKCFQYWPNGRTGRYGDIFVAIEAEDDHAHYMKRTMTVVMNSESRTITHYHYTDWPDKQVPTNLSSVLHLREIVRNLRLQGNIPILVHCSAGIGRTGTLIALDMLLDQAEREGAVDVYRCVTKLREQRTQMVQTLGQYKFLYSVFSELGNVGRTALSAKTVTSYVKSQDFHNKMMTQFQFLEKNKPKIDTQDLETGKFENIRKNRDHKVIAADGKRVIIMAYPDLYINAVYVPDYRRQHAFCATQLPLQDTVADFWKMVFELKSHAVVCLETEPSDNFSFIPQKKSPIVHDKLYVGVKQMEEQDDVTIENIEIKTNVESEYANVSSPAAKEDDNHELQLYKLKSWTQKPLPKRDLTLLKSVFKQVQTTKDAKEKTPVTVVCQNGATESGLYIALSILVDNMTSEDEVDVFQVVKLIRQSRPEFIGSQEQYTMLYQTVAKMVDMNL